jgi:DNA mismatch repair ATPase MutS
MDILKTLRETLLDKDCKEQIEQFDKSIKFEQLISFPKELQPSFCTSSCEVGRDVYADIELFDSYNSNPQTIFTSIDCTQTYGGKEFLQHIIKNPISDITLLNQRSKHLHRLTENYNEHKTSIDLLLEDLHNKEKALFWLFSCDQNEISDLYEIVYFQSMLTGFFNKSDIALTLLNMYKIVASPLIGILTPLIYFILPYLVIIYKFKIKVNFLWYLKALFGVMLSDEGGTWYSNVRYLSLLLSLLLYFQGVFNSVEVAKISHKISLMLFNKIEDLKAFIQSGKKLVDILWNGSYLETFVQKNENSFHISHTIDYFNDHIPKSFSLVSNFGENLKVFKQLEISNYIPFINQCYLIDSLLSICKVKSKGYKSVEFVDSDIPSIDFGDLWHPCINNPVRNDIFLGSKHAQHCILTGPNAGGKSTLLKSLLTNVILCQTLCIGSFSTGSMTPFYFINSQINIPDCKGKESLFEAEMYRCKYNIDVLTNLNQDQFAFIGLDEIFNSTNPVEGIAGAYAIMKHIVKDLRVCSMLTTHYLYLTKLKKEFPNKVNNMMMKVNIKDNSITFPYQLTSGVSRQYIALNLLLKNGFDKQIIEDAMEIKERLSMCSK